MKRAVSGLRAWLVQRVSAVFMLLFMTFVLARLLFDRPHSYLAWRGWMLGPAMRIATVVFFAALIMHAWVGLRDVVIDYVQPVAMRVFVLSLLGCCLTALGAWVVRILFLFGG
jgi:succinate dehydrogenase / fumarate reductase membrane anchor subunit